MIELRQSANSTQAARLLKANEKLTTKLQQNGVLAYPSLSQISLLAKAFDKENQIGLKLPSWLDQSEKKQIRELAEQQLKLNYQKAIVKNSAVVELLDDLRTDLLKTTLEFQPQDVKKGKLTFFLSKTLLSKTKLFIHL